ncbi:MAG: hypothetical protein HXS41_15800 [Theionarchaea archaeon]|nr:hypothetical protein [Theionarchaea archaeon]
MMRQYFDLNERVRRAWENNNGGSLHNGTIPVALPETEELDTHEEAHELPYLSVVRQVLMYLGAFVGVLLSSAIMQFRSGALNPAISIPEVVLSAAVAFVIIPVVYEKLNLNPDAPFIVQFALFVQNGVFWHMLIDSIGAVM